MATDTITADYTYYIIPEKRGDALAEELERGERAVEEARRATMKVAELEAECKMLREENKRLLAFVARTASAIHTLQSREGNM
jgi:hypothetical protein